jgi:HK97 family phage major capsid protein
MIELLEERNALESVSKRLHDLREFSDKVAARDGGSTPEEQLQIQTRVAEIAAFSKLAIVERQPIQVRMPLVSDDPRDRLMHNLLQLSVEEMEGMDREPIARARRSSYVADLQRDLQQTNDELLVASLLLGRGSKMAEMRSLKLWRHWERLVEMVKRDMDTGTAAEGGNWVPSTMSSRLMQYVTPELVVARLFEVFDMPSKTWEPPIIDFDPIAKFTPENGAIPATDAGANKATLTAVKLAVFMQGVSSELDEDTAIAFAETFIRVLGRSLGRGEEDAIINGDTTVGTGSAQDTDIQANAPTISTTANGTTTLTTGANFFTSGVKQGDVVSGGTPAPPAGCTVVSVESATSLTMSAAITAGAEAQNRVFTRTSAALLLHARKAWNGLRKTALISGMSNEDLATFTDATLPKIPKAMGRYGSSMGAWIVGHKGFGNFFINRALMPSFLTLDQMGGNLGVFIPGQIASYCGRPVILSDFVREDVASTGLVTNAASNTFSFLLFVCRSAFLRGRRRGVEVQRTIHHRFDTDEVSYRGTWRGMFKELFSSTAAANKIVGIGRNFS